MGTIASITRVASDRVQTLRKGVEMDSQDSLANVGYVLDGIPNATNKDYELAFKYLENHNALDIAEILGCNVSID